MPKHARRSRHSEVFSAGVFPQMTSVELCAGAGGQALGLERAGFYHKAVVEIDRHACNTLRYNRPDWNVVQCDVREFDGSDYKGVDLLAAGLPCPPFSRAGKQLGSEDERNLFPAAVRLIEQIRPRAVLIENVRGILDSTFDEFRDDLSDTLLRLGYVTEWRLLNACDFGVPQLRPRVAFVGLRQPAQGAFTWPTPTLQICPTVGDTLRDLMGANGWRGVEEWAVRANRIAPTIVGGSHKHGGPDLGPTRARKEWALLHVDGLGIADRAPTVDFAGMPRLTVPMVARIQGFPDSWTFTGGKTAAYRQVGNAFPPPVAEAIGKRLVAALGDNVEDISSAV